LLLGHPTAHSLFCAAENSQSPLSTPADTDIMSKFSFFALLLLLVAITSSCTCASDAAPESGEQLPPGVTIVGDQELIPTESTELFVPGGFYRRRFMFPFGGGFRYGWRYPIGYWNSFGRAIYGPRCLFGRPFGGSFYC
jgi:hypothetical protein